MNGLPSIRREETTVQPTTVRLLLYYSVIESLQGSKQRFLNSRSLNSPAPKFPCNFILELDVMLTAVGVS